MPHGCLGNLCYDVILMLQEETLNILPKTGSGTRSETWSRSEFRGSCSGTIWIEKGFRGDLWGNNTVLLHYSRDPDKAQDTLLLKLRCGREAHRSKSEDRIRLPALFIQSSFPPRVSMRSDWVNYYEFIFENITDSIWGVEIWFENHVFRTKFLSFFYL